MTALARNAVRRLWGAPLWGAPPSPMTEQFQRVSLSSGKRMRAVHAQAVNHTRTREAPSTAAVIATVPVFSPSLFTPILQTDFPKSFQAEASTSRLLQVLSLQQQQQQQQELQHKTPGWGMSADTSSSSSSSSSSSRWIAAHHNLPESAFPLFLDKSISPVASLLPFSSAAEVYLQLQQIALNEEDACISSRCGFRLGD
ncbi:hypothetical protein Emed_002550 [Eimeria media]